VNGLRLLLRQQMSEGTKSTYIFVNERGMPFGRMGIGRMIERAGEAAKLPFPVHVHMLRHSTGYALAGRGMDTRRLQHYLGHASITNTVRYTAMGRSRSRTFGGSNPAYTLPPWRPYRSWLFENRDHERNQCHDQGGRSYPIAGPRRH
jgi:Phage integrase family